jgi:hypothetical protein
MNDAKQVAKGVNGISLGVHKVFEATEEGSYLQKRFAHWNLSAPPGYKPHVHDLPPVYPEESLARLQPSAQVREKELQGFRECAAAVMDYYFPLIGNESVVKDTHTFTKEPYLLHPAGTAVVIRRTSKAILFFIDPSVHVECDGSVVSSITTLPQQRMKLWLAATGDVEQAKIATKILSTFALLLPEPGGAIAKCGLGLVDMILGTAGSSGPSWDEIKEMMREVVREELVTNNLEFVQADYESVMKWSHIQYLPNREGKSKDELWNMMRPQIDTVGKDINLLLQTNHRIPGFGLLLLGVDMYLGLLQEQISLGYDAKLREAGEEWATSMLKVWEEVQEHRHEQITVTQHSYGVAEPSHTAITCYYWQWTDNKTGESKGSRSGPWQAGGKHDHSESDCRADAEARYQSIVFPEMVKTFGDPVATAKAWRNVRVPELRTETAFALAGAGLP